VQVLLLFAVLLLPTSAWAYRPFVSTDAAVADLGEVEVELGYFNLERTGRQNVVTTPGLVVNYGVAKRVELVGASPSRPGSCSPRLSLTSAVSDSRGSVS